ncbi:hypothetical protein ACJIZ3_011104 [Penstemon smallii]|uniref:Uncharacterized protein n=1 Tax=Penstemon smallii TaxID=265156 RepID=A0ABD3UJL0_9LAMI
MISARVLLSTTASGNTLEESSSSTMALIVSDNMAAFLEMRNSWPSELFRVIINVLHYIDKRDKSAIKIFREVKVQNLAYK